MMRMLMTGAAILLAGCATMGDDSPPGPSGKTCNDSVLTGYVGQMATAALGSEMLRRSNSATLRWAPPGAMLTMDLRPDRLTVSYDRAMRITSARCG